MKVKKPVIPSFEYSRGHQLTEKLKKLTGSKTLKELQAIFDVPKDTFSTWNLHNRTSHELMLRLALRSDICLEKLALTDDELIKYEAETEKYQTKAGYSCKEKQAEYNAGKASFKDEAIYLKSYLLSNGKLTEAGEIVYSTHRLSAFALESENLIEIVDKSCVYLIDKGTCDAVSGTYLINIDDRHSINTIQRLPKMLTIDFDGEKAQVNEKDIDVIGKVVLTIQA